MCQRLDGSAICILWECQEWLVEDGGGTYISFGFVKDDQTPAALVKDAVEDFIKDHLGEPTKGIGYSERGEGQDVLCFYGLSALSDHICNMRDLYDRVGLNNTEEILFEKGVIERGEMRADGWVGGELCKSVSWCSRRGDGHIPSL